MPPLGIITSSSSAAATAHEPAVPILPAAQTAALAMVSHHLPPPLDVGTDLQHGASGMGGGLGFIADVTTQVQIQPLPGFPQVQVSHVVSIFFASPELPV
jgi:hypothetical protein